MLPIRSFLLIVVVTMLVVQSNVYAAFPIQPKANPEQVVMITQPAAEFNPVVNTTVENFVQKPASDPAKAASSRLGTISLLTGIAGLGIAIFGITISSMILVGFAIVAGIVATVLGARNIKRRPKRGFAIAGMVLGLADIWFSFLAIISILFAGNSNFL